MSWQPDDRPTPSISGYAALSSDRDRNMQKRRKAAARLNLVANLNAQLMPDDARAVLDRLGLGEQPTLFDEPESS